ncbi:unnamed protein product, partial [Polarella glacialis]
AAPPLDPVSMGIFAWTAARLFPVSMPTSGTSARAAQSRSATCSYGSELQPQPLSKGAHHTDLQGLLLPTFVGHDRGAHAERGALLRLLGAAISLAHYGPNDAAQSDDSD